jgi:hypothetical protein
LKRFSPPFSLRSRHFVVIGPTSDLHPRAAMVLREWRFWRPGYQPVDKPHPQRSCGRWRVQAEPCWPPVCLRRVPSLSVAVVDQGPLPGRGLAYGAKYDCHLLNVSRWPHERSAGSTGSFLAWGAGKLRTISASHESSTASPLWAIREFLAEGSRWARWCRNLRWIQGEVTSFAARAVSCDCSVERRQHAGYKNRGARSG